MTVYIVMGEVEGVYQDEIGGPFLSHPRKEIVKVFSNKQTAEYFVQNCRLSNPKKERYGDTSYYKFGYCDMEIESCDIVENKMNTEDVSDIKSVLNEQFDLIKRLSPLLNTQTKESKDFQDIYEAILECNKVLMEIVCGPSGTIEKMI